MNLADIGKKIRAERKKMGLTLEQLARKVGVSVITLQRIETGKSSPSVILLSEIAIAVNKPIFTFFGKKTKPFMLMKRKKQKSVSDRTIRVKFIGPRKMITDNIIVTLVELKKGQTLDPHTAQGIEWAYNLEGRCEFTIDGKRYYCEPGDSVSFDASMAHSVTAIDDLKFIGIYVKDAD